MNRISCAHVAGGRSVADTNIWAKTVALVISLRSLAVCLDLYLTYVYVMTNPGNYPPPQFDCPPQAPVLKPSSFQHDSSEPTKFQATRDWNWFDTPTSFPPPQPPGPWNSYGQVNNWHAGPWHQNFGPNRHRGEWEGPVTHTRMLQIFFQLFSAPRLIFGWFHWHRVISEGRRPALWTSGFWWQEGRQDHRWGHEKLENALWATHAPVLVVVIVLIWNKHCFGD